eukprot:7845979-Pyramimonas_sp.AAC.1
MQRGLLGRATADTDLRDDLLRPRLPPRTGAAPTATDSSMPASRRPSGACSKCRRSLRYEKLQMP